MAKRSPVLERFDGIPLTTSDLRAFTTVEERRGYRAIALIGAGLVVLGIGLAIAGVRAGGMTANLWWVVSLIGASLGLAYGPLGWAGPARDALPVSEVVAHLNEQRIDTFWFERGVSEESTETRYRGHEERPQR
jgi:hypothetical protein